MLKALFFLLSIGVFVFFLPLFGMSFIRDHEDPGYEHLLIAVLGYTVLLIFFSRTYNATLLGYTRIRRLVLTQMFSQAFAGATILLIVSIVWNRWSSPLCFLQLLCAQMAVNVGWSWFGTRLFFRLFHSKKTIFLYGKLQSKRRLGIIRGKAVERLYSIARQMQYDGDDFQDIREILEDYEAVFAAGLSPRCRNGILVYCQERDIPFFFLPDIGDVIIQGAQHIRSFDSPLLYASRKFIQPEYRIMKRIFDILGALAGIVLLSPLFLLTAVAVRLCDAGPVLYRQERLTQNGKVFRIIKFRSMNVDAEKDGVARLSTGEKDGRITPAGRVIRRFRIDEIPQLFNVLKGDMSFVGPRPERPEIAEKYCKTFPEFKLRLQVKAGITGYAQVYGRYDTDEFEKLEFDILYMNSMSLLTDLELLLSTLMTLFSRESIRGVEAEREIPE